MWHLYRDLYSCSFSPFGICYNPISMGMGLKYLLSAQLFTADQLIPHRGLWHSLMHHGSYSMPTPKETLHKINTALIETKQGIEETSLWIFTFGTSYIYECAEPPHQVVNNCHQLPATHFRRRRISVEEITSLWQPLLQKITANGAEVVMTVSPIPHYRDGAHESRLSKAALLLAIDELVGHFPQVHYFPSYEIQLDELRDYRFFKADMAHPTEQAVEHIISRFAEFALRRDEAFDHKWAKLRRLTQHRPLSNDPAQVAQHYQMVRDKISLFAQEFPHPYLQDILQSLNQ